MKIIISQQGKKLTSEFYHNQIVYKHSLNKAEEFLLGIDRVVKIRQRRQRWQFKKSNFYYPVDKLIKKPHTVKISDFRNARLEFRNTGLLTERVIRAIMLGLLYF